MNDVMLIEGCEPIKARRPLPKRETWYLVIYVTRGGWWSLAKRGKVVVRYLSESAARERIAREGWDARIICIPGEGATA